MTRLLNQLMRASQSPIVPPSRPLTSWTAAWCFAASNNCLKLDLLAEVLHSEVEHRSNWRRRIPLALHGRSAVLDHFARVYDSSWSYTGQDIYRARLVAFDQERQNIAVMTRLVRQPDECVVTRFTLRDGLIGTIEVERHFSLSSLTLTDIYPPEG